MAEVTDVEIAAWVKEQNHGVPPWEHLDAETRAWWRERYWLRHGSGREA